MVMTGTAPPVERLPFGTHQHIDVSVVRHPTERPVDRGQADAIPLPLEPVMQFLCAAELVRLPQQFPDGHLLPGKARFGWVHRQTGCEHVGQLHDSHVQLAQSSKHPGHEQV